MSSSTSSPESEGSDSDSNDRDTSASGPAKSTNTVDKSTENGGKNRKQAMLEKWTEEKSQNTTFSLEDFLARVSHSLEKGKGSKTLVGRSFTRYAESLNLKDLRYCSLKTSKVSSQRRTEKLSESSSNPWTSWGMMSNGRCLTARTSESPRIGPECSLSDILMDSVMVDDKYFLSREKTEEILEKMEENRKSSQEGMT